MLEGRSYSTSVAATMARICMSHTRCYMQRSPSAMCVVLTAIVYVIIMNGKPLQIFGRIEQGAIDQIERCLSHPRAVQGALMADGHLGYSMPIGGVVAYDGAVSPTGVGFDIAC